MTWTKRLMDLVLVALMAPFLVPLGLGIALWLRLTQGAPVLYGAERMRAPGRPFTLWKFRSMTLSDGDSGVSGGDKAARITPQGRVLRRLRLDEIPQLWNILRGDISFVGPRPPLRAYVERFPALYGEVLKSRPGVTGLATLVYHRHEEALLARCATRQETDAVYARACVPRKAALDLIYQKNRSACMDLWLIVWTMAKFIPSRWRPRRKGRPV